jgi:hypothetical protein
VPGPGPWRHARMTDMAFLTPRETIALAALVNSSPVSIVDLARIMTKMTGQDISPEATKALARSLVGQSMAQRSTGQQPETYRATVEGRAWLVANTEPEEGAACGYSAAHKMAGTPAVTVIDSGVAGIVPACAACADSDAAGSGAAGSGAAGSGAAGSGAPGSGAADSGAAESGAAESGVRRS